MSRLYRRARVQRFPALAWMPSAGFAAAGGQRDSVTATCTGCHRGAELFKSSRPCRAVQSVLGCLGHIRHHLQFRRLGKYLEVNLGIQLL
jgi:hypothetical protein